MSNVNNVTAGKPKIGGAVHIAALNATLPTDATSTLTGFTSLGYCSEDGLVNSNARTSTDIKAWGGDTVLSIQSDKTDTFAFTLLETLSPDALKVYFGDSNVSGTLANGITIAANAKELEAHAWVIDMVTRDNGLKRVVIPNGKVTATEDITYSDGAAVGLGVTVTAYPDASGNTHYEYIKAATTT